jgi:5-methylcytosine-specific restriction endonuclease McrA
LQTQHLTANTLEIFVKDATTSRRGWLIGSSITTNYSFDKRLHIKVPPKGLISDFGYKKAPSPTGFSVQDYEARLAHQQRQERRQVVRNYRHMRNSRVKDASTGVPVIRAEIVARDNSTCYLCGLWLNDNEIHLDHVIPVSKGGLHDPSNIKVACAYCNLSKGAKILA